MPRRKPGSKGSGQNEAKRIDKILEVLAEEYPDATCALHHRSPFELLVATILSAQCTDERVNLVTPQLFETFPTAAQLAEADPEAVQLIIKSTGFFRNKSKNLIGAAKGIVERFSGRMPRTMEQLLTLPGVARKTANVVLGTAFGIPSGVVVDTHVSRIAYRLGLTTEKAPEKIEKDLMNRIPEDQWIDFSHRVIHHGRRLCRARSPKCVDCRLTTLCPYSMGKIADRARA